MITAEAALAEAMAVAHHELCHDTGCFDGDDISNPAISAAIERAQDAARAEVLREVECTCIHGCRACLENYAAGPHKEVRYIANECYRCRKLAEIEGRLTT